MRFRVIYWVLEMIFLAWEGIGTEYYRLFPADKFISNLQVNVHSRKQATSAFQSTSNEPLQRDDFIEFCTEIAHHIQNFSHLSYQTEQVAVMKHSIEAATIQLTILLFNLFTFNSESIRFDFNLVVRFYRDCLGFIRRQIWRVLLMKRVFYLLWMYWFISIARKCQESPSSSSISENATFLLHLIQTPAAQIQRQSNQPALPIGCSTSVEMNAAQSISPMNSHHRLFLCNRIVDGDN